MIDMTIKKSLAKCFSERALGLTRPEIEQLLEDELNKPDCEIDGELVSLYVELLWEIDGKSPEEDTTPMVLPRVRLTKRSTRVLLAVAAVSVLLVTSVLVVSAKRNGNDKYKLSHYTMEKYSYGYVFRPNYLDSEPTPATETERTEFYECRKYRQYPDCSFDEFYLQEAFMDGAKILHGDFRHFHEDTYRSIAFEVTKDGSEVGFRVKQFNSHELLLESMGAWGGITYTGIPERAYEVMLDGIPVLVVEYEGCSYAFFVDGNSRYSIDFGGMNTIRVKAFIENMTKR